MILQPLVENSIKHGLARKVGEGRITIRAVAPRRPRRHRGRRQRRRHARAIGSSRRREHGIGLRNVNERLRVIYGANYAAASCTACPARARRPASRFPSCSSPSGPPPDHDRPLRVLVVDDEQLAREELCFLLGQVGGVEIVGQAADGVEALRLAGELQPDLVFLDVQMPGPDRLRSGAPADRGRRAAASSSS